MINLYPHQKKLVSQVREAMLCYKHVIAYAPCAFGKSFTFCDIAKRTLERGKRVMIITHRIVLLSQNAESMKTYGVEDFCILNDHSKDVEFTSNAYIVSTQTIQSRLKQQRYVDLVKSMDLVIIDEAHLEYFNHLFESGLLDDTYVIGFTGSPRRMGNGRQLGLDYDTIVGDTTVQYLIDINKLTKCRYFTVPFSDIGIKKDSSGDYQQKSSYQKFDNPEMYGGCVENYMIHGDNKQFICFCTSIAHTIKTCVEFNIRGFKTLFCVSSITEPKKPESSSGAIYEQYKDRLETWNLFKKYEEYFVKPKDAVEAYKKGARGICCINILSIGFDYKPLPVLIINKATTSLPLYIQLIGRVQRPYKDKTEARVLDLGGNVDRFGEIEKPIEFSLWHEASDSVGIPATKICGEKGKDKTGKKGCNKMILASYSMCPFCGYRFATEKELRVVELKEKLAEKIQNPDLLDAKELCDYAELKGYKKRWVFNQLWFRGEEEFKKGMRALGYDWRFIFREINVHKKRR